MNRLFAAVAISALALSGAAFAADAPATAPVTSPTHVQKAQAPATTKSMVDDHGKKSTTVKKSDKKTTGTESAAPASPTAK
jgi:opacity protein-like surface antigen